MNQNLKRRRFLQNSIGIAGALLGSKALASGVCTKTVAQMAGPFYPGEGNILPINDLTRVEGATKSALGQVIYLKGIVQDLNCRPIEGVNVEIWQACASGRYNHDRDPNPASLDPNFRYWGETFTDAKGEYNFKSIVPGAYPADTDWDRPPHIHFRIAKRGYVELITQMYFKGDPLNDTDKILERIPKRLRNDVIVDFRENPIELGTLVGQFNISIEKI
jgi:protocatechuate 3,4-dioxygenase, beta subunit